MTRPLVLDLCCRAGGAAVGYARAGARVVGVDIEPQPDYPFPFLRADALDVLRGLIEGRAFMFFVPGNFWPVTVSRRDIAWTHASWPCQAANPLSTGTNKGREYPQLIPEGRELMTRLGLPGIIENTAGAPIRKDLALNGDMFRNPDGSYRLGVWRPRWFEFLNGFTVPQLDGPKKPTRGRVRGYRHGQWFDGPYVAVYGNGGGKASLEEAKVAMGIDWMTNLKDLAESIPPDYTHYIGTEWLRRGA